jgi:hypothetical protein
VPEVTSPSFIRCIELRDLAVFVPGGRQPHLGFPAGLRVELDDSDPLEDYYANTRFAGVPSTLLEPGDIWLLTLEQVIGRMTRDQRLTGRRVADTLLGKVTEAVASAALQAYGFIPFVFIASSSTEDSMPKPAHCLVTYSGVFGSQAAPTEIWSFGMTFLDTPDHGGTTQELADKARAAYDVNLRPRFQASTVMTRTRVAFLGDGAHVNKLPNGAYDQADTLAASFGTRAAGPQMPLQTALAVSFYTARPGATGRGRSFLPLQGQLLDGFLVPEAYALECATALRDIAEEMYAGPGATVGQHAVMSYKGYSSPVTTYRCGRVPDTMRSRRNALKEQYSILAA